MHLCVMSNSEWLMRKLVILKSIVKNLFRTQPKKGKICIYFKKLNEKFRATEDNLQIQNVSGVSERVNGGKCIEATFKFVFSTIKGRHWSLAQRN